MSPLVRGRRPLAALRLVAAVALLLIGGWWLAREAQPRLAPLEGGGADERPLAPLAEPARISELAAMRELDDRPASALVAPPPPAADADPPGADTMRPLLLHVVDHDTRAELREVTVERATSGPGSPVDDDSSPSMAALPLLARGTAPLRLEPCSSTLLHRDTIRVRATGYERATLDIDWNGGGERTIELRPAGGLDLDLDGAPADARFTVQLWSLAKLREETALLRRRVERLRETSLGKSVRSSKWFEKRLRDLESCVADFDSPQAGAEGANALRGVPAHRTTFTASFTVCRVDDLAAGPWAVALLSADRGFTQLPTLHGFGRFTIAPGERTALTLAYLPGVRARRVAIRGRVRFDRGWFEPEMGPLPSSVALLSLAPEGGGFFRPDDEEELREGANDDERRFEGALLAVGPAAAHFATWPYFARFIVPEPEGEATEVEVELSIPPPVALTVRTVANAGNLEVVPAALEWVAASDRGTLLWPYATEKRNDGQPMRLCLPAGDWRLCARPLREETSWTYFDRRIDVGEEALELRVPLMARIDLELRDREAIVPVDSDWITGSRVSGPGIAEGIVGSAGAMDESTRVVTIDGEGAALLHLEEPPGYAPIAPIAVELVRGKSQRVRVALERLR